MHGLVLKLLLLRQQLSQLSRHNCGLGSPWTSTYEVVVNVVIRRDATLPYEYDGLRFVTDAVIGSIAWPSSKERHTKGPEGTMKMAVCVS